MEIAGLGGRRGSRQEMAVRRPQLCGCGAVNDGRPVCGLAAARRDRVVRAVAAGGARGSAVATHHTRSAGAPRGGHVRRRLRVHAADGVAGGGGARLEQGAGGRRGAADADHQPLLPADDRRDPPPRRRRRQVCGRRDARALPLREGAAARGGARRERVRARAAGRVRRVHGDADGDAPPPHRRRRRRALRLPRRRRARPLGGGGGGAADHAGRRRRGVGRAGRRGAVEGALDPAARRHQVLPAARRAHEAADDLDDGTAARAAAADAALRQHEPHAAALPPRRGARAARGRRRRPPLPLGAAPRLDPLHQRAPSRRGEGGEGDAAGATRRCDAASREPNLHLTPHPTLLHR